MVISYTIEKMEIQIINDKLTSYLYEEAATSKRLRQAFDLRTTSEDGSQRMLNALQPSSHAPIQGTGGTGTCFTE